MLNSIDIEKVRRDTQACESVLHFNNAGAALMPDCVYNAVIQHLELEHTLGGYEACDQHQALIQQTYDNLGQLLSCQSSEIALVENATRAWDMAFYSIPFKAGDKIITAMTEYASNYLAFLQVAQRYQVEIVVVPNDPSGQLDTNALTSLIDERVKLIAISHVPSQGGLVNPAVEVGRIARDAGILYLLDACQSVGQIPLNVQEIGCDFLSGTGRKYLRGPRGTGFLYVKQSVLETLNPPFVDMHAATWTDTSHYELRPDAKRFETWESFVAGRIGLGVAVSYALTLGLDAVYVRIQHLAQMLRSQLQQIPGIQVKDQGIEQCGIVTFTKQGESAVAIRERLRAEKIHVSVSNVTYAQLDMGSRGETEFVRASVHYYNTEAEIYRFFDELKKVN